MNTSISTAKEPSLLTRTQIIQEYNALRNRDHCPLGMYIMPSAESLMVWEVVLFIHQGYYADAILRFHVTFPNNYPSEPPQVKFVTDVFHPLIHPRDGTLNISPRFPSWRPTEHRIFHLLHWIKSAFKKEVLDNVREEDCLNKEAYRYRESTPSFASLATQSAALSRSNSTLYENSSQSRPGRTRVHDIPFTELKKDELNEIRNALGLKPWIMEGTK